MAIVKMSKFDLVVFAEQRAKVLKKLQKFKEVNLFLRGIMPLGCLYH